MNLGHLRRLTDDAGILQHARYGLVSRDHGYATDDNARALLFTALADAAGTAIAPRELALLRELQPVYLSFVDHAFDPGGGDFRPFMGFSRTWEDAKRSEDADGRALWGLAACAAGSFDSGLQRAASELFARALPRAAEFGSPRAWCFALLAIDCCRQGGADSGEPERVQRLLAERLQRRFVDEATAEWPWPEHALTYDNARLPQALISAGRSLGEASMVDTGLRGLEWLLEIQLESGVLAPVGNDGWYPRGGVKARFDQQPLEAQAMAEACRDAYRATGDARWRRGALVAANWFLGANVSRRRVHDPASGGCHDALTPDGLNENMGAESTLAWLSTQLVLAELAPRPRRPGARHGMRRIHAGTK